MVQCSADPSLSQPQNPFRIPPCPPPSSPLAYQGFKCCALLLLLLWLPLLLLQAPHPHPEPIVTATTFPGTPFIVSSGVCCCRVRPVSLFHVECLLYMATQWFLLAIVDCVHTTCTVLRLGRSRHGLVESFSSASALYSLLQINK